MDSFVKKLSVLGVASLALGTGLGLGGNLITRAPGSVALATAASADPLAPYEPGTVGGGRSTDELATIRVAKAVSPAVVTILERGGLGSGVVIDGKKGLIITNNHVVEGSGGTVRVKFSDAKTYPARVLGTDPVIDIAVVKVDGITLPQAPLGDSDKLEIGQTAVAIGNPLGLGQTLTHGVVSAVNRKIDQDDVEGMIQTDAAINPGNSGGPLLDSQGRVIGINRAVVRGNEAQGLGFAVPINVARDVAQKIIAGGNIQRAHLGISMANITPEMRYQFRLPVSQGVILDGIDEGSPAERAGLRQGDVITSADGQDVTGRGDLLHILRAKRPGDAVAFTVRRPQGKQTVTVRLDSTNR